MPSDLPALTGPNPVPAVSGFHPASSSAFQLGQLDNEGKVVSGTDREGDQWTITVHGPGEVIVSDITPNDGVLDDDLDTIQLIGTDINKTFVTGQVTSSAKVLGDGVVTFNHLVATQGVASIILNGFTLTRSIPEPAGLPVGSDPSVFLPGGVKLLQFHNITALTDLSVGVDPFNIIIGDPTTPLAVKPIIRLDEIFNTVFNSSVTSNPFTPQTEPTVNILVNGQLQALDIVSSTAQPIPASQQFAFPTIGITGRTAVRALGINHLNVTGSANNVTAARQSVPFTNGLSGLDHLGQASFGGNADALGLDVAGPIGKLKFARGLGNPTGTSTAATQFGTPFDQYGYPAFGFLGGLVTSTHIGSITAGPANTVLVTSNNPDLIQTHPGSTRYFKRPGNALTNAAILSSGSIGNTLVVGNTLTSEIKAGFHYPSFVAGLEGTRAISHITNVQQRGSVLDSAVSATYRPANHVYGSLGSIAGKGSITGHLHGTLVTTGATTPLNNSGAGFFARKKVGYLPPPSTPNRVDSVLIKP
jgi:hypothetical protein